MFLTSVMAKLKFVGIDPFTLPPATACGKFISEGNSGTSLSRNNNSV